MQDSNPLGALFKSSIFGKITPVNNGNNVPTISLQHSLQQQSKSVKTNKSKPTIYVPSSRNERPLYAVYPNINNEAFTATMNCFRVFVAKLNDYRRDENILIDNYNEEVKKIELNSNQITLKKLFIKKHKTLCATQYNKEVAAFFDTHKFKLPKKKLHIVKYQTELVFQQFLHEYATQLKENTKVFKQLGIEEKRPLKQLEINSFKIVSLQRNGVKSIDVSKETIKNHRRHLVEAGVLFDYTFCGHKRGVKCHINSEILTVLDLKTQQLTTIENQLVKERTAKNFGNNKEVTVTELKNNNIKENVENISLGKGTASPDNSFVFYGNTNSQDEKKQTGAAAKNVKLSESLLKLIENEYDLCNNLAAGKYNNYKPIDIRALYQESLNGTTTREQFKELVIQDFFKNAARLYRNSTPYFGSWLKAYLSWMQRKFLVNGNLYRKDLMVEKLQEFRWRLNHATKWFQAKGVRPLFPNQYFDFTRTTSKEIGFEFTKNAYTRSQNSLTNKAKQENKMLADAKKRKERINHAKKFDLAFKRFTNNRATLNDTLDYIKNNLPENFRDKFSERLIEYSTKK
ncbi:MULTISPECIES: hypothetical protein [Flavobacterium]|uniref:Phage integrase SAM-like domain-containing protein n=1 Tax=Flavobacterium jumunjinense TaxID=998845 RepID=A0ABV5GUQ7_9FLAO|nr:MULTISPECIES: hypothetical protein [Flavobacterium]